MLLGLCSDRNVNGTAGRIRALREALELTQEKVAAAGDLLRTEVVKLEGGQNQARSDRIRAALTRAFGVDRDALGAYLDGSIDLAELLRRRDLGRPIEPSRRRR